MKNLVSSLTLVLLMCMIAGCSTKQYKGSPKCNKPMIATSYCGFGR